MRQQFGGDVSRVRTAACGQIDDYDDLRFFGGRDPAKPAVRLAGRGALGSSCLAATGTPPRPAWRAMPKLAESSMPPRTTCAACELGWAASSNASQR